MHKSKLVRTLSILTAEEMKQLLPFLQSPYFNTNSNIVKLYKVLRRYYPDFVSPKLAKEVVFKKLYPDKEYAHQQLLNLMSEFYALLEKYIVVLQLEKKELAQKKLLVEAYSERSNCYDYFEKKYDLLNKQLDSLPFRDAIYFSKKKELSLMYYAHPDTSMQVGDKGTLYDAIEYFEAQKKITDIKLKCALNARLNTVNERQSQSSAGLQLLSENPLFNLYFQLERLQRSEESVSIDELVGRFKSCIHLLRNEDKRNVIKILLNHNNRLANVGFSDYSIISLELYKLGLEHDCFLEHNRMSKNVFTNIVSIGAICGDFSWTENFIKTYQSNLDNNIKVDAVRIGLCVWHFEKKDFEAAIDAALHSFKEPMDVLKSKLILIKSWFELWLNDESYLDLLNSQLDAIEKYLRRDKYLRVTMKNATFKSISYIRKIIAGVNNEAVTNRLKDEINTDQNLAIKRWLVSKLG